MLKRLFLLMGVLLLGGLLLACQSPTSEPVSTPPQPTATQAADTPTPEPTAVPATDTPIPEPAATPLPKNTPVAAVKPLPTPTAPWQIPEIQPDDWVTGGADAGLIIVDYGDYQ